MGYPPIEDHGIVGDLHTVALVAIDGSIDFMCFPHFDSPTLFAALLDEKRGGRFQLSPTIQDVRHKQLYLSESNILLTRFLSNDGVAEISDFMPMDQGVIRHDLVRRIKTIRGEIPYRMMFAPRFDYARSGHRIERQGPGELVFIPDRQGLSSVRLLSSVPLAIENGDAVAEFHLSANRTAHFIMEEATSGEGSPAADPGFVSSSFKWTLNYWRRWVGRSAYHGRWREMVDRSALTLKLLTSEQYGSICAAATFALPEVIGGSRNWDYRYAWVRDASFTLYALMRLGYMDEAYGFMKWIEARCGELTVDGTLQVMYRIDGSHHLEEDILGGLEGYQGSRPVRIGNAACTQLQLDIYGELMDSVYLYDKFGKPIPYDLWTNLKRLINWLSANWNQSDEGIWEVRGGRHEFLYSRLMCWVAVDRALRLATKRSLPAPHADWLEIRDKIYCDIFENFWNEERRTFVQYKGSKHTDAASLMMPMVNFISPTDPRWLSTLKCIEGELVSDSLVHRYTTDDFLVGKEGTFSICTFWYAECLARAGDLDKARFIFEKMLGYGNHLGLFSEQLGPKGEHLGNFPQAFTHLGLISAAYYIDRQLDAASMIQNK